MKRETIPAAAAFLDPAERPRTRRLSSCAHGTHVVLAGLRDGAHRFCALRLQWVA